jgi:SAM-dependent methyltransferase
VRSPPLTPLAAAALHVQAPERALVIGCGDGEAVLLLAREFPGARVRGVDPSPDAVRAASARVGLDPEGRVAFKVGKPRALPYPDEFFELVAQVDGRAAPVELARVLRPGGHAILASSRPHRLVAGARRLIVRRRLAASGIAVVREEIAGEGSFLLGRREESG